MTLLQKQQAFARAVAELILEAFNQGYEVTMGEAWRPPATAEYYASIGKGIVNSLHTIRLAIDLPLFKNEMYLTDKNHYFTLGCWWKAKSTPELEFKWGGDFATGDANHFSIEHEGIS